MCERVHEFVCVCVSVCVCICALSVLLRSQALGVSHLVVAGGIFVTECICVCE